jgi:hypothetical protein
MTAEGLDRDLLVGADAIAKALGLTKRQVYAMREAGNPLVRREPGLGLVASREAIRRHFSRRDIAGGQK